MTRGDAVRILVAAVLGVAVLGGCSTGTPDAAPTPSTTAVDPAVKPYCDAVAAVQAEQSSPQAGQGGVAAASDATRRQIASVVAVAPPEIAGDWRVLQGLTERSLGLLAATGGDPQRIDRPALDAINRQAAPTVAHIKTVTQQRCGIAFAAAPAPAPAPAPVTTSTSPTTSTKSSKSRTKSPTTTSRSTTGG